MTAEKSLGAIYLAIATAFGIAIALHQHPGWQRVADSARDATLQFAQAEIVKPTAEAGRHQLVRLYDAIDPPTHVDRLRHLPSVAVARREQSDASAARQLQIDVLLARKSEGVRTVENPALPSPALVTPLLRPPIVEDEGAIAAAPERAPLPATPPAVSHPSLAFATPRPSMPEASTQQTSPVAPTELTGVIERLRQNLTPEMLANFKLFLYVSKADAGPWAQHMYVFSKDESGGLNLQYNWLVSTGREKVEYNPAGVRLGTHTPPGYYELDPDRLYRHYTSSEWGQPMPYAMFFNWVRDGNKTGLAIHAAHGDDIGLLGKRASAGCVRLAPENARLLFDLIRTKYHGLAPRFATNHRTGTMSNDGILLHDPTGQVRMAEGYKVLVFIENYGGKDNVVAALF
jgi:lipoprotein-anchoring transpeptidase ErfK/SrfK